MTGGMVQAWRVVASKTVLRDRWIDVRADDCRTPGGQTIAPYYVLAYPDWVNVVALTDAGLLVLVEQYRHAAGSAVVELPGGAVDAADASLLAAAQRELLEETGYAAAEWRQVSSLYPNPATQTNRVHTFLANGAHPVRPPALEAGEEGMAVRCLPLDEVLAGLPSGLLGQAMHVAGLLLALR